MLVKFALIVIALVLLYYTLKGKFGAKRSPKTQDFVQCEECGVFADKSEMKIVEGKFICKECKNANNRS